MAVERNESGYDGLLDITFLRHSVRVLQTLERNLAHATASLGDRLIIYADVDTNPPKVLFLDFVQRSLVQGEVVTQKISGRDRAVFEETKGGIGLEWEGDLEAMIAPRALIVDNLRTRLLETLTELESH